MSLENQAFARKFLQVSKNSQDLHPQFFGGARNVLRAPLHRWKNNWLRNIGGPPQASYRFVVGIFGMQSCHICGECGTFFVLNFGIFAFGVGWGVKLSDPMSPKSLKNCSDVDFLGDFKDAAFGVSVDTRLQRLPNFSVVGNDHVLA